MSEEASIAGKKFIVVIPKKVWNTLGIKEGQKVRFKVEEGKILLEPIIAPEYVRSFFYDVVKTNH